MGGVGGGVGVGIGARHQNPLAVIFGGAGFHAPLRTSLILARGVGNPTFTRSGGAWVHDHEGVWRVLPDSNSARFGGARLVRNVVGASEPTGGFTAAGTTPPTLAYTTLDGTNALAVTFPAGAGSYGDSSAGPTSSGSSWGTAVANGSTKVGLRLVVSLSRPLTGAESVRVYVTGSRGTTAEVIFTSSFCPLTSTLVAGVGTPNGSHANPSFGVYFHPNTTLSSPITITATRLQISDLTGASVQAPPEYVSRGVLSAPYHGAGDDGVKWFDTTNGNSLASNILTEAAGAPIARSTETPLMLLKEDGSTNYLTYSNDCTNAAWVKTNITAALTATGPGGVANTASTLTATAANGTCLQTLTRSSVARVSGVLIKRRTGTGDIDMTQDNGTTWTTLAVTSSWQWLAIPYQTHANPVVGFRLVTSGDEVDVWCVQHEEAPELTSPIQTTTVAAARSGEALAYPMAGNVDDTVGTLYAECYRPYSEAMLAASAALVAVEDSAGRIFINTSSNAVAYDGTSWTAKTGLGDVRTGIRKRAMSYSGSTMLVTGDGAAPTSGAFDGNMGAGGSSNIGIGGSNGGGNPLNGYISNVYVWRTARTAAELQAITT